MVVIFNADVWLLDGLTFTIADWNSSIDWTSRAPSSTSWLHIFEVPKSKEGGKEGGREKESDFLRKKSQGGDTAWPLAAYSKLSENLGIGSTPFMSSAFLRLNLYYMPGTGSVWSGM